MPEIKSSYTFKEIKEFVDEKIRNYQRTTSHNVKVLFAMYNFLFPNKKEYTTGCTSCVQRVKNAVIRFIDDAMAVK